MTDVIPVDGIIRGWAERNDRDGTRVDGRNVKQQLAQLDTTMVQLLPDFEGAAFYGVDDRTPLTHSRLRRFVTSEFNLKRFGVSCGDRCVLMVPPGPELALCILSCMCYCTCVPIDPQGTEAEHGAMLKQSKAKAVIVTPDSTSAISAAEAAGVQVITMRKDPSTCGLFSLEGLSSGSDADQVAPSPNSMSDIGLLLATSGTTGTKKIVPVTVENLAVGALCIATSIRLSSSDCILNMMPLFHVGGICRNLLAPVLCGASVVVAPSFEAQLFWELIERKNCTIYYASPTIHLLVLQAYEDMSPKPKPKIRLIANAAGGLLPTIAERMRATFVHDGKPAVIMPSYGMTECMPISAPPPDYQLDRIGTSGQSVGPEIRILNTDTDTWLEPGTSGEICVGGAPTFHGYEDNVEATRNAFFEGFFKTGDLGFLDEEGFLFINGRSKEVINRGGELISPYDIEEAIIVHPCVKNVLCFGAPHDTLQEVCAVVIVTAAGCQRPSLSDLNRFCCGSLHPSKWPVLAVYMDDVPKGKTGKPLRVKLGDRLDVPLVEEKMGPEISRMFEAPCPPKGTPLSAKIPMTPVQINLPKVRDTLGLFGNDTPAKHGPLEIAVYFTPDMRVCAVVSPKASATDAILEFARENLHGYECPQLVFAVDKIPYTAAGEVAVNDLPALDAQHVPPACEIEQQIQSLYAEVLDEANAVSISTEADFFEAGGDSITAGRLASLINSRFGIFVSASVFFTYRTIEQIAKYLKTTHPDLDGDTELRPRSTGPTKQTSSPEQATVASYDSHPIQITPPDATSLWQLSMQGIPEFILTPVFRISLWFVFAFTFQRVHHYFGSDDYGTSFALSIAIFTVGCYVFLLPMTSILLKWLIIGKYRPGRHPIWSWKYSCWWLANKACGICGKGLWLEFNFMHIWYCRAMGANIGWGVKLDRGVTISEYDLVTIENNVILGACTISPFSLGPSVMILEPVRIGADAVVNSRTIVTSGTAIQPKSCLPAQSSCHEAAADADECYRQECRSGFPKPSLLSKVLVGWPVVMAIKLIGFLPYLLLICWVYGGSLIDISGSRFSSLWSVILWFADPWRLMAYILLRPVKTVLMPIWRTLVLITCKRFVVGKFEPGRWSNTQWGCLQLFIMEKLVSHDFYGLYGLLGRHYSTISLIYRALGVKVGERIYWPGTPLNIGAMYDLIEIQDDVVFGARVYIQPMNADTCANVTIMSGAMCADRCYINSGVTIHEDVVLGSGSQCKTNGDFAPGSLWMGSKGGNAVCLQLNGPVRDKEDRISPFGRAFYQRKCSYKVYAERDIVAWCVSLVVASSIWRASKLVAALEITKAIVTEHSVSSYRLAVLLGVYVGVHFIHTVLEILLAVGVKWLIMGRRMTGPCNWDVSPYNQTWNLYRAADSVLTGTSSWYSNFGGTQFMVYYYRALGATIGKNVCLFPRGAEGNGLTEPELVTLGDYTSVGRASMIAHINSRGHFELNNVKIGRRCTLCDHTRAMSGSRIMDQSMLLEHTVAMPGEIVGAGTVWQGWPAKQVVHSRAALTETLTEPLPSSSGMKATCPPSVMLSMPSPSTVQGPEKLRSAPGRTESMPSDCIPKPPTMCCLPASRGPKKAKASALMLRRPEEESGPSKVVSPANETTPLLVRTLPPKKLLL
jgi:non-ribosomal peptide synthetase-like protein